MVSLEALDELIAAVADLQKSTERELRERRERLSQELAGVEAELADLTEEEPKPKPKPEKKKRSKAAKEPARKIALTELVAELEAAPDHTLNIRAANLEAKNIKALAKANPNRLQVSGKGAQLTVTLAKSADQTEPGAKPAGSPQATFAFGETLPPRAKRRGGKS